MTYHIRFGLLLLCFAVLGSITHAQSERKILTGVPSYKQWEFKNDAGKNVYIGCGPTAAIMLLAYFDRRMGYKDLIGSSYESTEEPTVLAKTLRTKLGTITVTNGQGLTEPTLFQSGLKKYIKDKGYSVEMDHMSTKSLTHSIDDVFNKSVELIANDLPHIILFDAYNVVDSQDIIFPTHYSVVVGYNKSGDNKILIVNPGWGYPFQEIDLTDSAIKPVRIIWADITSTADGSKDGHTIGPEEHAVSLCSADYVDYVKDGDSLLLQPTIVKYSGGCTTWKVATRTKHPITGDGKPHISVAWWE